MSEPADGGLALWLQAGSTVPDERVWQWVSAALPLLGRYALRVAVLRMRSCRRPVLGIVSRDGVGAGSG